MKLQARELARALKAQISDHCSLPAVSKIEDMMRERREALRKRMTLGSFEKQDGDMQRTYSVATSPIAESIETLLQGGDVCVF